MNKNIIYTEDTNFKSVFGLIPSNWNFSRLTDVLEVKHGFQFRDFHFSDKGIPIIKIGNLVDGSAVDLSNNVSFISLDKLNDFENFKLKKFDVLMALTGGTLGKVSIFISDSVALQNYRVGKFLTKDRTFLHQGYIYWILRSEYIQNHIKNQKHNLPRLTEIKININ